MTDRPATPEFRVDPLTGLRVIAAPGRSGRPGGGAHLADHQPIDSATDPFAAGNESMTPPEVWADRPGGGPPDSPGWRVRAVPNLYPALVDGGGGPAGDPLLATRGMPQLLASGASGGSHEVIVNTPQSVNALGDLDQQQLNLALDGWASRIAHHAARDEVACVHLCVNEGSYAGASLAHTHAQLYALPFVPAAVARERERMRAYYEQTQGRILIEDMLAEEVRAGTRIVAVDDDAVLLAPFASSSQFQLMIVPRAPRERFEDEGPRGGALLHQAFSVLRDALGGAPALNLWVRTAPAGAVGYCWRIDLVPRLSQPAGLELGAGVFINSVTPEQAAEALREQLGPPPAGAR
jgi:UDPglucose--hexose-1-phosphate uridylyltransferase